MAMRRRVLLALRVVLILLCFCSLWLVRLSRACSRSELIARFSLCPSSFIESVQFRFRSATWILDREPRAAPRLLIIVAGLSVLIFPPPWPASEFKMAMGRLRGHLPRVGTLRRALYALGGRRPHVCHTRQSLRVAVAPLIFCLFFTLGLTVRSFM